jgi:hypothetical protein
MRARLIRALCLALSGWLNCHLIAIVLVAPAHLRVRLFDFQNPIALTRFLTRGYYQTPDLAPSFFREVEASIRG